MKININVDNLNGKTDVNKTFCSRVKKAVCYTSIWRCLAIFSTILVALTVLVLCKAYVRIILLWLENQDSVIVSATIILLFIIVSFPVSVGYIILVVASGYLFGITHGLLLTVIGANFGLLVAHNLLKLIGHHSTINKFTQSETAKAIMCVISGPLCFKIVFCSRLTPIPFGLQNTIFALSNVNGKLYHVASLLGLFPAQLVGVYCGSTLRSMQDVLESRHISSTTYVFVIIQLIFGAGLMVWFSAKARNELLRALAEAENKYNTNSDIMTSSFSVV